MGTYAYGIAKEIPLEFPDGTTPVTSRIVIYSGDHFLKPKLPDLPDGSLYFQDVVATVSINKHL